MTDYLAAFITGLTTGGLSCLAVQGGLLTSSIARQVEKSVEQSIAFKTSRKNRRGSLSRAEPIPGGRSAIAILVFLIAKVAAYTMLGLMLGWLGSAFQLTPVMRGWFQLGIGLFMLGNALRMFNVHPIFRYFSFEPPSVVTRFIRRKARSADGELLTPALLGLLTVLIPCGVTQAMMALALATGNPVQGAVLMFAFTLGTSPVFFVLAYLFTRLGSRLERGFVVVTAILILALGVVSVNSGLNLLGSPVSISSLFAAKSGEQANLGADDNNSVVRINVENAGYSPNVVYAKAGVPVRLELVTDNTQSCTRAFTIPVLNVAEILPKTGTKVVDIPAQKAGKMSFSCSMGMYTGVIVFQ
jgi:sulfite exporter TauE/SafE